MWRVSHETIPGPVKLIFDPNHTISTYNNCCLVAKVNSNNGQIKAVLCAWIVIASCQPCFLWKIKIYSRLFALISTY